MTCSRVSEYINTYCKPFDLDYEYYEVPQHCDGNLDKCHHLTYLKVNYEDLDKVIAVLKGNEVYRVAEGWKLCSKVIGKIKYQKEYKNTILYKYLAKNVNCVKKDTNIMINAINEYQKENNIKIPDDRTLVVHLRLGDDLTFFTNEKSKDILKQINDIINKYPEIDNITIVTALHYGVKHKNSMYEKSKSKIGTHTRKWLYSDVSKRINYDKIKSFLKQLSSYTNKSLFIRSNTNIDHDLVFLVNAKYLLAKTGGAFTTLINEINTKISKNI